MQLTMSLIKADLIAARQAIEYYDKHEAKDIKTIAAYHIQQAAEKLIKIQIYAGSAPVDHTKLYTHNLEKLIGYAETLQVDLLLPKFIRDNSLILTDWEAGSRYDLRFRIRIDTLRKALNETDKWYEAVYASGIRQA